MKPYPDNFEPLVVIGVLDDHVMVYTGVGHEDTLSLLEDSLHVMLESGDDSLETKH